MTMNSSWKGPWATIAVCLLLLIMLPASCSGESSIDDRSTHAQEVLSTDNYDEVLSELLKAEQMIDESTPLEEQERLYRRKGITYYYLDAYDKFIASTSKALEISKEMGDTALIAINLYNLGVNSRDAEKATNIYEEVLDMATQTNDTAFIPDVLEKLAQAYIGKGEHLKARICLNKIKELNYPNTLQLEYDYGKLLIIEDSLDKAHELFLRITPDSLNSYHKADHYYYLYKIKKAQGDLTKALEYRDSMQTYTDSLMINENLLRVEKVETEFKERLNSEKEKFDIFLYSGISIMILSLIIIFVISRNLSLKRKQVSLTDKIADLNVRMSQINTSRSEDEDDDWNREDNDDDLENEVHDDMPSFISEKMTLSRELFETQPQAAALKKLTLIREFTSENKDEIRRISDCMIGRFSDCCADIQRHYTGMTNDDCLYCVFYFCGCRRDLLVAFMGSSDDALRRRKSRIKKKLPGKLFDFLFES